MELSTKGRYAVMALIDLAMHAKEDGAVSLSEIATRQTISLSYLEQLFAKLRRHGLVKAKRGPNGGYKLAKSLANIDMASVIFAVDEPLKATACDASKTGGCQGRTSKCVAHDLWTALTIHIQDFMRDVTLEDVLNGKFENQHLGIRDAAQ
jgi:Rrf2 family transcriptional regulator, iron-sulfur cluster assembly transcription factor